VSLDLQTWLGPIRREYVETFIPEGGGAVRFVVCDEMLATTMRRALTTSAEAAGLFRIDLDTADVKLHMLQSVFFAIAGALDWDRLVQTQLEAVAVRCGYRWPMPGARVGLGVLADANGIAPAMLRTTLQQEITRSVWQDQRLAQDFRKAVIALLSARIEDDADVVRGAVLDWLHGRKASMKALGQVQIGARIGRSSARAMLISLCHWVRDCGLSGLLVTLDVRRLLRERREVSSGLVYAPAAVMDCYEVIRQVIDDAEHFPGLMLVVTGDARLINDDVPKRSLTTYTALKMRVWDDVRPHGRDNPLSPLVVLAA